MATFQQGRAVVVGVGNYKESKYSVPITFHDAQGVYDALVDPQVAAYPKDQVTFLHDEEATSQNIIDALSELGQRAGADDSVLIFLAGHGAPADDGTWHFATHDTEFQSIKSVKSGNALSQEELLYALRKIKAQKILVLINACFSGLVSPTLAPSTPVPPTLGTPPPDALSTSILGTGEGRAIITASRGNQYSMFDPGAERTFFGDALVKGLNGQGVTNRNGYIGLFELYEFLYTSAKAGAKKYNENQEPVLTVLQGIGPFPVALYKGSTPGNLAEAGFMKEPPPNTAANVVKISAGAGSNVSNISGSNNRVTQTTRTENIGRNKNTIVIGAGATATQVAAGENIQQTIQQGASASELAKAFQEIYKQVDARPDDPNFDKSDIKAQVKQIEAEAAKGENAKASLITLWLTTLQAMAPDIFKATTAALMDFRTGTSQAVALAATKARGTT